MSMPTHIRTPGTFSIWSPSYFGLRYADELPGSLRKWRATPNWRAKPPTNIRCFAKGSCHLTTDGPIEELHAFAERIGLRRVWFQEHPLVPHYDLTATKRAAALAAGALFVPSREQARYRRERKAAR